MENIKTIFRIVGLFSLFTSVLFAASYSCPGEDVLHIDGAIESTAKSYDTTSRFIQNGGGRYWKFETMVDGTITIMQNTLKNEQNYRNHRLLVGTSCGGSDIYQGKTSTADSTTFPVQKNKTYYVKIEERNNRNQLNVRVSFVFAKQGDSGCSGCDCKYDTGNNEIFNDTSPGVKIAELSNKTTKEQKCFSGISVSGSGHNEDNFYFIAGTDGNVSVNTSSPNMHDYHMKVTRGGTVVYADTTTINHSVHFKVAKGDRVVLYFKEAGDDADKYEATVTFEPSSSGIIENADDICYEDIVTSGMCIGAGPCAGGMQCKKAYPLKNIGDGELSDVTIYYDETGLGGTFGKSCGVDPSGTCQTKSNIDLGPVGLLGKTTEYDITNPMPIGDNSTSIWSKPFASGSCFNGSNLYATYIKNGKRHRGKVKPCSVDFTCANPKDYDIIYRGNAHSKMIMAGNTNLCKRKGKTGHVCQTNVSTSTTNNNIFMINDDYDDIIGEADYTATLHNSSAAYVDIPKDKKVVWAGLFWQGYMAGTLTDADKRKGREIKFKQEGDTYQTYTDGDMHWVYITDKRMYYQSFVNVTKYVKSHGGGYYWVGDIATSEGTPEGGSYGAWTLAVVYEDDNEPFRNTTIFYGYKGLMKGKDVTNAKSYARAHGCPSDDDSIGIANSIEETISGFLTPKSGNVDASLIIFAGEGDTWASGEYGYITDKYAKRHKLTNAKNPDGNIMNSTITKDGNYVTNGKPHFGNNSLGIDIDTYDMSGKLSNYQTSTKIGLQTDGDGYFPGMFGFEAQLKEMRLCYDFTYGQNGHFQTAPTVKPPKIEAQVSKNDSLDVKIYFKNLEKDSDVIAKNITVDIDDINTTQATYKRDSTYVTRPNSATRIAVQDSGRRVADKYDKDIPVGDLGGLEYFYTYYSLEPKKSTIDMMLNAFLRYDLAVNIGGTTVTLPGAQTYMKDMNPCQTTNAYKPVPGRFNVVHQAYKNTNLSSGYYYNIPTQVVKRYTDNFVVESMNPNDLNTTKPISTAVALEMVEMDGFHYVTATCTDVNATVLSKKRLWVIFDSNTSAFKPLTKTDLERAGFFDNASRNAAFRLAYNVADANDSVIQLSKNASGKYTMLNFSNYAGANCASSFVSSTGSRGGKVSDYCGSGAGKSGNGMDANELRECMECIFSINTFRMCSRDNFAIRPEAFKLMFSDQNQTNPSQLISLGNTATKLDLASGYDYKAEVNATSHVDDNATPGYYGAGSTLTLQWNSTKPAGACNDTNDVDVNVSIINGRGTGDVVLNQVGEYKLHLEDKEWTAADWRYLAHHSGKYFKNGTDCIANSHAVAKASTMKKNGCVISSEHNNSEFSALKYFDYTMEFHPYKFDISSIVSSVGLDDSNVTTNAFVYNANMDENASGNYDDINMSYHLYGSVIAQGENNATLSNFVSGCYAKDIKIVLPRSAYADTSMTFKGSVETLDGSNNRLTIVFEDVNNSKDFVDVSKNAFAKSLNGTANVRIRYNFKRDINESKNPQTITFKKLSVGCKNAAECRTKADLGDHDVNASSFKDINETIRFYYARAYVPDSKIIGNSGTVKGYYEIYCSGSGCNKALLPQGAASKGSDDPRWWINESHTSGYGKMKEIKQKRTPVHVTLNGASPSGNATENIPLLYDEQRGYPYKATMKIIPNRWLIYNKYNANADHNEFDVKFEGNGEWAGKNSSKSATGTSNADKSRILKW